MDLKNYAKTNRNENVMKQFVCAKEMLTYILEGHDLYNPIIECYVFACNDRSSICVYNGVSDILAENLSKNIETGEAEHWSELLCQTDGMVFKENGFFKNIDWCESYYMHEGWINNSDYLKYLAFEEENEKIFERGDSL